MTTLEPIAVAAPGIGNAGGMATKDALAELESLEYSTLFVPGDLTLVERLVHRSERLRIAPGILAVDRVPAAAVREAYATLERDHPGRFLVGLGGAHGPHPVATLRTYLDELDREPGAVPAGTRILAALGPRMLELARDRTAAAYPYLVTPEYAAGAKRTLGPECGLSVLLDVVPRTDRDGVREIVGTGLRFLMGNPGYASNLRRMGFTEEDLTTLSDRLIDGIVAWGDISAIADRIRAYRAAGADQVVLQVRDGEDPLPVRWWRELAPLAG